MHTHPIHNGQALARDVLLHTRREPIDVAWMREWLDVHLDGLDWPAVVSSSVIEDAVLKTYPRWQTRLPRLREIISRSLHAAGYVRRSVKGRAWDRAGAGSQLDPTRSGQAGRLILVRE